MKATMDIDEALYRQLKIEAARTGRLAAMSRSIAKRRPRRD